MSIFMDRIAEARRDLDENARRAREDHDRLMARLTPTVDEVDEDDSDEDGFAPPFRAAARGVDEGRFTWEEAMSGRSDDPDAVQARERVGARLEVLKWTKDLQAEGMEPREAFVEAVRRQRANHEGRG